MHIVIKQSAGEVCMPVRVLLASLVILFLTLTPCLARTWYITPDGLGDAPSIQAGIDSTTAGDTVLVADGTYTGIGNRGIRYNGKSLTVMSESGDPTLCTVDCSYLARGFIFDPGDGPGAVLEGITITRGRCLESVPPADSGGGGIWCDAASPSVRSVTVSDCDAEMYGGGMWCSGGAAPELTDVVFTGNSAAMGGGMYCEDSSPELTDVTFFDNYAGLPGAGGGMFCEGGSPLLTGVQFLENVGDAGTGGLMLTDNCGAELRNVSFTGNAGFNSTGGLYCSDSSPLILNCNFSWNWGSWAGGIRLVGDSAPVITACTFFENSGDDGGAIACYDESAPVLERTIITGSLQGEAIFCHSYSICTVTLSCCDIHANSGGDWTGCIADQLGTNGNFSADPLFCDTANEDFSLEVCSPCLPDQHPEGFDCSGIIGAFGPGCTCGAQTEPTTWGAMKSLYK
jgi:hypothetical protein